MKVNVTKIKLKKGIHWERNEENSISGDSNCLNAVLRAVVCRHFTDFGTKRGYNNTLHHSPLSLHFRLLRRRRTRAKTSLSCRTSLSASLGSWPAETSSPNPWPGEPGSFSGSVSRRSLPHPDALHEVCALSTLQFWGWMSQRRGAVLCAHRHHWNDINCHIYTTCRCISGWNKIHRTQGGKVLKHRVINMSKVTCTSLVGRRKPFARQESPSCLPRIGRSWCRAGAYMYLWTPPLAYWVRRYCNDLRKARRCWCGFCSPFLSSASHL